MAKINIVVPGFPAKRFSGGIWCLMEYASGLAARGHQVTVLPVLPCRNRPKWFTKPAGKIITSSPTDRCKSLAATAKDCFAAFLATHAKNQAGCLEAAFSELMHAFLALRPGLVGEDLRIGVACHYLKRVMPPADVTLATASCTALPVRLQGSGRLLYFMQHYEPLFFPRPEERLTRTQAEISYSLGLEMIVNSSWLRTKIETEFPKSCVFICRNAIDHRVFHGNPRKRSSSAAITVISYSGGNIPWKGFREMAEAVKIARDFLRGTNIRWLVYGPPALLPPTNAVAAYEWLGFLQPSQLAAAYRSADLLLSASWYESFPLFPLEAMACGIPVIATPLGTEDYAIRDETAEVVAARDAQSIANGLIRLIQDPQYSYRIARAGNEISKQFTWERSVSTMEDILVGTVPAASSPAVPLKTSL